jgi:transcriptional regulator with PAS, ATPase and Fis domain
MLSMEIVTIDRFVRSFSEKGFSVYELLCNGAKEHEFEFIVGSSPALLRVLGQLRTVAPTDTAVLIEGETGTGKN